MPFIIRRFDEDTTIRAAAYWGPLSALLWEDFLRDALEEDVRDSIEAHMNHQPSGAVGMLESLFGIHKITCTKCDFIIYEEEGLEIE